MTTRHDSATTHIGLLVLRLGIGGYMLTHGWPKLQLVLAGDFDKFADPIGLGTGLSLVLVTLAEFGGALFVILGLGTRFAAASIVVAMAVAAFVVHANDPWTMQHAAERFRAGESQSWSSKEPALLFLIPALALVLTGGGALALDRWLWPKWLARRGRGAGRA